MPSLSFYIFPNFFYKDCVLLLKLVFGGGGDLLPGWGREQMQKRFSCEWLCLNKQQSVFWMSLVMKCIKMEKNNSCGSGENRIFTLSYNIKNHKNVFPFNVLSCGLTPLL